MLVIFFSRLATSFKYYVGVPDKAIIVILHFFLNYFYTQYIYRDCLFSIISITIATQIMVQ
jgi:hypothetical protein